MATDTSTKFEDQRVEFRVELAGEAYRVSAGRCDGDYQIVGPDGYGVDTDVFLEEFDAIELELLTLDAWRERDYDDLQHESHARAMRRDGDFL